MSYGTVYCKDQDEADKVVSKIMSEFPASVLKAFTTQLEKGIVITLSLQSPSGAFAKQRDYLLVDKETGQYFVECAEWDSEMTSGEEYVWHVGLDGRTLPSSPGIQAT